jgi:hypothetical protein
MQAHRSRHRALCRRGRVRPRLVGEGRGCLGDEVCCPDGVHPGTDPIGEALEQRAECVLDPFVGLKSKFGIGICTWASRPGPPRTWSTTGLSLAIAGVVGARSSSGAANAIASNKRRYAAVPIRPHLAEPVAAQASSRQDPNWSFRGARAPKAAHGRGPTGLPRRRSRRRWLHVAACHHFRGSVINSTGGVRCSEEASTSTKRDIGAGALPPAIAASLTVMSRCLLSGVQVRSWTSSISPEDAAPDAELTATEGSAKARTGDAVVSLEIQTSFRRAVAPAANGVDPSGSRYAR